MANYIEQNGVLVPDTSSLLEDVKSEYKQALGEDLDTSSATPQGRLIEAETLARKGVLDNCAKVANTINPLSSFGKFLDALCALTGTYRRQATKTQVLATISGQPGATIPAGSQAKTEAGDLFQIVNSYTFTESGTANRYFEAVETGPVPCVVGTLNQIVSPVIGWETITNPAAAVIGQETESDTKLKQRRTNDLFKGTALLQSIKSAILGVPGVLSCFGVENYDNISKTVAGKTIPAHSIWFVVDGGADEDVANALFDNKSLGCGYVGDVSVNITGEFGQTYSVKFDKPTYVPVETTITVKNPTSTSAEDIQDQVKKAVEAWALGSVQGVDGLSLGTNVSPFEIAAAVSAQIPDLFVSNVTIAEQGETQGTSNIEIAENEKATIEEEDITVVVV